MYSKTTHQQQKLHHCPDCMTGCVVQITEADSQFVRRSDCDTLFIVANYQPDKKDPSVAVNDEHALMRFEFVEAIVRLAVAKYGKVCASIHAQIHAHLAHVALNCMQRSL